MHFPQFPDRGPAQFAADHHHHVDVASGRAEVAGGQ
jgi:hypothetical protein